AAAFFFNFRGWLVLSNGDTGQEYARYRLKQGEEFSITFIHSVNKTPVTDCYDVGQDGKIYLRKTVYYDFGAGVPFDLDEGETLSYAEDGAMVISGIDRTIPDFYIFVGTVSDHTLSLGGKEISLRDLCGRNSKVHITYELPHL
ncbi:MAG: DUF1850 domain-containing protein, partial [Lawsonibacter sp.]|nr:DUF1850 domain-containing protein [Lawsonibacter sp.]